MSANWWADPMPPGWESKWDPGQNKYFFIDHSTKKTSWVDPRSPQGRHQVATPVAQPRTQAYGGAGTTYPAQPRAGAAYPMQPVSHFCTRCGVNKVSSQGALCAPCVARTAPPKCNLCNRTPVARTGDACNECTQRALRGQQETSFTNQASVEEPEPVGLFVRADETLFNKLKDAYPKALESHIRSALESNDNNEQKARRDLEKRGYKKVSPMEVKTQKLMEKLRPKYTECSQEVLRTTIMSCDCIEIKTVKKLKELGFLTYAEKQEKERLEREAASKKAATERNIRRDFASVPTDLITMALEAAEYNEQKTRTLLKSMASDEEEKTKSKKTTKGTAVSSTSQASTSRQADAPKKPTAAPRMTTADKLKTVDSPKSIPVSTANQRQRFAQSAPSKRKFTTQAKPMVYKSKLAHGADPNLPKGAQDDLLLKGYCQVAGPNPDSLHGPSCRVMGSQGAYGPDMSLVKGAVVSTRYQAILV